MKITNYPNLPSINPQSLAGWLKIGSFFRYSIWEKVQFYYDLDCQTSMCFPGTINAVILEYVLCLPVEYEIWLLSDYFIKCSLFWCTEPDNPEIRRTLATRFIMIILLRCCAFGQNIIFQCFCLFAKTIDLHIFLLKVALQIPTFHQTMFHSGSKVPQWL